MKIQCDLCGGMFSKGAGYAAHRRACEKKHSKLQSAAPGYIASSEAVDNSQNLEESSDDLSTAKPADSSTERSTVDPQPEPMTWDSWSRENPEAKDATDKAAKAVERGASGGASGIMACLAEDGVGVPALIALACLRALPPALTDDELLSLRAVWEGDQIELSPGMQRLLVTVVLVGPRVLSHPTYGTYIRGLFVKKKRRAVAAPTPAPTPAPTETPTTAPTPPPANQAAPVEVDLDTLQAWERI
jgi:hypothetical protein